MKKWALLLLLSAPALAEKVPEDIESDALEMADTFAECAAVYDVAALVAEDGGDISESLYHQIALGAKWTAIYFADMAGYKKGYVESAYDIRKTYWLESLARDEAAGDRYSIATQFCIDINDIQKEVVGILKKEIYKKDDAE